MPVVAAWNELPSIGEHPERVALVELADRLQWSAPELAARYARRAIGAGPASGGPDLVRAYGLLAAALVRLERHADAVEPALAALRAAAKAGLPELESLVRLDLAACARELGEPLLGCTILRPVLEVAGVRPATRAVALGQLVGCTVHVGRRDDLEDALAEADRLLAADDGLSSDARRLDRALLAARTSAYHRRHGENEDAVEIARQGLGLLARLRDGRMEGGRAWARLIMELVLALLDDGQPGEAEHEAGPLFARPARSAAAPSVGRTLLAVAIRVMVPSGRVAAGRGLLDYVLSVAERHDLGWLLADALSARADLDELAARPGDALHGLRAAHAAEHRHRRSVEQARRQLVIEFGLVEPALDAVTGLLRTRPRTAAAITAPKPADPPPATATETAQPAPVRIPLPAPAPVSGPAPAPAPVSGPAPTTAPAAAVQPAQRPPTAASTPASSTPAPADSPEPSVSPAPAPSAATGATAAGSALAGPVEPAPAGPAAAGPPGADRDEPTGQSEADHAAPGPGPVPPPPGGAAEDTGPARPPGPTMFRIDLSDGRRSSGSRTNGGTASALPKVPADPPAATIEEEARAAVESAGAQPDAAVRPDDVEPASAAPPGTTGYKEPGTTNWLIRDLLAPLIDHPTLTSKGTRGTMPPEPEPDDIPEPPRQPDFRPAQPDEGPSVPWEPGLEPGTPRRPDFGPREPDFLPSMPGELPGPVRGPEAPDEGPGAPWSPAELPERPGIQEPWRPGVGEPERPGVGEPERPGVGEPGRPGVGEPERPGVGEPGRPGVGQPERPGVGEPGRPGVGEPERPGLGQPGRPGLEEPGRPDPAEPDREPWAPGEHKRQSEIVLPDEPDQVPPVPPGPQPQPDVPPPAQVAEPGAEGEGNGKVEPDTVRLEPVAPPEEAESPRTSRRRERTDTTSIADLLTEALVAYQATEPDRDEPGKSDKTAPVRPSSSGSGRHRMPDWGNV
ncbi:MAG TPA: hypothetical protein VFV67_11000 [Actinophytocola sp.]|uniref:hypothetical protein n=1 Tax=Actinophytocola sp. TaxID=1872138 RepID=UPI002DBBC690|nr:hypothetical protein [Actinophytocola sp.]HEU5471170.1 hypothetical protein [Actinophytocola sp.]